MSFPFLASQNGGWVYYITQCFFKVGEEEAAGSDLQDFPLYPHRSLPWSGWSIFFHGLVAAGHLAGIVWTHDFVHLTKGSLFVLFLGFHQPPQHYNFPSLGHRNFPVPSKTHMIWGAMSPIRNLPNFCLKSRNQRATYKSHIMLYSLFSFSSHSSWGWKRWAFLFLYVTFWVLSSLGV